MNKNKRRNQSKNKNNSINNNNSKNIDRIKKRNRSNTNSDSRDNINYADNYDLNNNENDTITINNNASIDYKNDEFDTINNNPTTITTNNNAQNDNSFNNRRREENKSESRHEKKNKKSKKNILLSIIIIILIIALTVTSLELYFTKSSNDSTVETTSYYGQRGNISDTEKIMFLSKEEDYLVGMMGLEYSTEEVEFDNDSMTRFALYIAMGRYSNILTMEYEFDGSYKYRVDTAIIDDIIEEFFGVTGIIYSVEDNEYYSQSRGYFLFNEQFEKSMWFYPVSEETIEVAIGDTSSGSSILENDDEYNSGEILENEMSENDIDTYEENVADSKLDEYNNTSDFNETNNTNSDLTSEDESVATESYIIITADAIYIDETLEEKEYKNAKYEGMYDEDCVEYTIKFKFDENGYLVSYQYA